ncbi:homoserine kinase [Marmoricola sp. RAF53]|uniref:homoserine kinase n=1 Tax=Marmoricola sp. RAF53 TaxID=3233059 RepID=UPI003F9D64E7
MAPVSGGPFVSGPVSVAVPATSANLGPGFDCLGLALDLHDQLTAEIAGPGVLEVEVVGEGAADLPRDERHLVVRSMRRAFEHAGVPQPGLRLRFENAIPQSRGLGSSSAAIVGGLALARALLTEGSVLDDGALLVLANGIEGHPDNVAPALFGGFVVCGQDEDDVWADQAPIAAAVRAVVFVPPTGVSTEAARGLLPDQVPHAVAAANAGRAALLVAALGSAPHRLHRATEDFLHQSFRARAMPASYELVTRLRAEGHAAVISGAGPTVLVLTTGDAEALLAATPEGWASAVRDVDHIGVRVVTP